MKRSIKITVLFTVLVFVCSSAYAQTKRYVVTPDFDSTDYVQYHSFMTKPFAMTGQTLYLPKVSSELLNYFFVGNVGVKEKGDKSPVTFYKLSRMSEEKLSTLEGKWFIVVDYVADQFAYNRIYNAVDEMKDYAKMRHPFMKLLIGNTTDTVFYEYQNFYNQYHCPFIPMSYYNSAKNEYPHPTYAFDDLNLITYDTNANYAIVPDQLIGQKLSLPVVTDATYERLFNGTRLYNYSDDSRKYSFTDYPLAKARNLAGKTFIVKDVAFDAESLTNVYLKLVQNGSRDTIYYKYPTKTQRDLFPFVIESFYAKIKREYKDREFTVRGDKFPLTVIDIRRKRPLTLHQGDIFKCLDVVVRDGKYQLLMRTEKGRKFYMPEDYALGDMLSFNKYLSTEKIEKYRDTYPTYYKAICQKELIKGMSMDMVEQSWGRPERQVKTNFDGSDQQWFYMGNIYLIFKNNVLFRVAMIPEEMR
ncbi:MAG: hypothetical protein IJ180_09090 [Bacteroidales bacterium]|nr:hypothetical protein [Bacteroidales bacterium]